MRRHQVQKGFTLIEIMITVLIVGVLAAIAYPSYMSAVKKSNRAEAKAGLTDAAQQLQRCYTAYTKFNDATNCTVYRTLTTGASKITTSGGSGYYDITLDTSPAVTATTYRLIATAIRVPQTKDKPSATVDCTVLKIDQTGTRTPTECW